MCLSRCCSTCREQLFQCIFVYVQTYVKKCLDVQCLPELLIMLINMAHPNILINSFMKVKLKDDVTIVYAVQGLLIERFDSKNFFKCSSACCVKPNDKNHHGSAKFKKITCYTYPDTCTLYTNKPNNPPINQCY